MADLRLIPPSIQDSRTVGLATLLDRQAALDLDLLRNLYDPDLCPASALPLLALQFGVLDEAWVLAATEAARRGLVKQALQLQKKRGTPWALKQALAAIGWPGMTLQERTSSWAHFKITQPLGGRQVPPDELDRLLATIDAWKPARCVLEAVEMGVTFESSVSGQGPHYDGAHIHDGSFKHEGLVVDNIAYVKVGASSPTVQVPVLSVTPQGAQIIVHFHVAAADANGMTLDTFALYSGGNTEIARATTPPVTKNAALTLDITWTLNLV